ncbi:MAG TPA: CHAP domain-containing protein [Candidatus Saccharimonadales bacterium]
MVSTTTNSQLKLRAKRATLVLVVAAVGVALLLAQLQLPPIRAASISELQQQVNQLEQEIAANNNQLSDVQRRRKTLEGEVYALDLEIGNTNKKIEVTNKKIKKLELEIALTEAELEKQNNVLAEALRELYKRGSITTIELLASSDSYSDFISSQEYLSRLKAAIQESVEKVKALKQELEDNRDKQQNLAEELEGQKRILDIKRQERANLLAETRGEESLYQARNRKLQDKQAQLLAEIVSRSQVITGVGTGSYPWANYRENSWTHWGSCTYGDDIDPWGYCYRQCTSFAAWRLYSEGKNAPQLYGNATNWGYAAQANGIPTGSQPRVGAIAVWQGFEGHVAYVEEIYGNGTVRISEYNAVPALQGQYSQRIINAGDPSVYIYF